eukprot:1152685-Pelagomonas_calceolata.AAC.1
MQSEREQEDAAFIYIWMQSEREHKDAAPIYYGCSQRGNKKMQHRSIMDAVREGTRRCSTNLLWMQSWSKQGDAASIYHGCSHAVSKRKKQARKYKADRSHSTDMDSPMQPAQVYGFKYKEDQLDCKLTKASIKHRLAFCSFLASDAQGPRCAPPSLFLHCPSSRHIRSAWIQWAAQGAACGHGPAIELVHHLGAARQECSFSHCVTVPLYHHVITIAMYSMRRAAKQPSTGEPELQASLCRFPVHECKLPFMAFCTGCESLSSMHVAFGLKSIFSPFVYVCACFPSWHSHVCEAFKIELWISVSVCHISVRQVKCLSIQAVFKITVSVNRPPPLLSTIFDDMLASLPSGVPQASVSGPGAWCRHSSLSCKKQQAKAKGPSHYQGLILQGHQLDCKVYGIDLDQGLKSRIGMPSPVAKHLGQSCMFQAALLTH